MTHFLMRHGRPALAAFSFALLLAACKESMPGTPRAQLPVATDIEAGLVASTLSPDAGDTVLVSVRLFSGVAVRSAASFTARVTYDASRLTFDAEVPGADAAARVVNGTIPGDVRTAGFATDGFSEGELVTLRFVAAAPGDVGALRLSVDQLHATDGEDLKRVKIRANAVDAGVGR
jgi:hypothetical protein